MQHTAFNENAQQEVLTGLQQTPKVLSSKYFYDARGCDLFEQICELPEYYLTRTELSIMESHSAEMAERIGSDAVLIEYGSGASVKTQLLLDAMPDLAAYVPLDIASDHLQDTADRIRSRYPDLLIVPTRADFTKHVVLPEDLCAGRRVVYFPGSTIGNLPMAAASALLGRVRELTGDEGGMLLGIDLVKDPQVLEAAYNDSEGVTAEFNLNALVHINRIAQADFAVENFKHHAFYNSDEQRVEMHLESLCRQTVGIGDHVVEFERGERIRTELSHKYELESFAELVSRSGMSLSRVWTDPKAWFAVLWLTCASKPARNA